MGKKSKTGEECSTGPNTQSTSRRVEVSNQAELSLEELEIDVSAFIHYLKTRSDDQNLAGTADYWSLIPNRLEIVFSAEVEDYRLEKEVFSRSLVVVSRDVQAGEVEERKAKLFGLFESAITDNQIKAVTRLLKCLKPESRGRLREDYQSFKRQSQGVKSS